VVLKDCECTKCGAARELFLANVLNLADRAVVWVNPLLPNDDSPLPRPPVPV
jgi:hypothetical protein